MAHGRIGAGVRPDTGKIREALGRIARGETMLDVATDWGVTRQAVSARLQGWTLASDGRAVRSVRPPADYALTVRALELHRDGTTWEAVAEQLGTTVRRLKRLAERWAVDDDGQLVHRRSGTPAYRTPASRPPGAGQGKGRPGVPRKIDPDRVKELHAAGLCDYQIAVEMGVSQSGAADVRRALNLVPNRRPKKKRMDGVFLS